MPRQKERNAEENLAVVNQKIFEIKKKIQLSEGQRKAHFEECDAEKKVNTERISTLKKEVKEIYKKLGEPLCCRDSILKTSLRYPKEVGPLRNKKLEDAIEFMDLKCIDLTKRLDVIKYRNKAKKTRLKKLAEDFRDTVTMESIKRSRKVDTVSSKPICVLENQIHRVEMNMMEAEHVNKKYRTIRLHFLSESVEFESSLKKLEEDILKQGTEIKHLELINKEALGLRDITKGTLLRREISALNAGIARENQLQDFRHRVEERKIELEKLERRIFPTGRLVFDEGGDGAQVTYPHEVTNRLVAQLESFFVKLKIATGETETKGILPRFLSQKETKLRLEFLKRITEEEKKQLELKKEITVAELEAFKFFEVKEKEESQEEIEKMNVAIDYQEQLKGSYVKERKRIMEQLLYIRKCLLSVIDQLQDMNDECPPDSSDELNACMETLSCLTRKIQSGLSKMGIGKNFGDTVKHLEQNHYQYIHIPREETPLFSGLTPQDDGKHSKAQQPSLLVPETEDEEDVLSRLYLKRQAQLIVDAKSRKKFNRVLNFPRPKK